LEDNDAIITPVDDNQDKIQRLIASKVLKLLKTTDKPNVSINDINKKLEEF
jgi:hypothetical protein